MLLNAKAIQSIGHACLGYTQGLCVCVCLCVFMSYVDIFISRFLEVADLKMVPWFDITGKIEAPLLSPQTTYVVYLVFRLRSRLCTLGLIPPKAKASVRFFDGEKRDGGGDRDRHGHGIEITNIVSLGLQPSHSDGQFARYRNDNWMEIQLGEFFNGQGDTGEIEI